MIPATGRGVGMQAAIASGTTRARYVPPLAVRVLLVLLGMLACGVAFMAMLDAGADVEHPQVLRFDQAIPADDPDAGAMAMRLPRTCVRSGDSKCARDFMLPFDPPKAGGELLAVYIPQYT